MKNSIASFAFLLFFNVCLNAQDAVVGLPKMNVLYIGVDNPIEVSMPNIASSDLKVTVDKEAGIRKVSDGNYMIQVSQVGTLNIYVEAKGVKTTKTFRVKKIPNVMAVLDGEVGGALSVETLKKAKGLQAFIPNFDYDAQCHIRGYTVFIIQKEQDALQFEVQGSDFPPNLKAKLDELKTGASINIMNIRARCPGDSVSRDLGGMSFLLR